MEKGWIGAVSAYLWGANVQQTSFAGPGATVLSELERFLAQGHWIDRAETAHFDIALHKRRIEKLLKWHDNLVAHNKQCAERVRAQKLGIAKRVFEICEQERDWVFEMDSQINAKVHKLLQECVKEHPSDSAVLYYTRALF